VSTVHLVVPPDLDDCRRTSGGNVYDRRVRRGLVTSGWTVVEHLVAASPGALATALGGLRDSATVLLDGLVASTSPDEALRHAERLRIVLLLHLPMGIASDHPAAHAGEARLLRASRAVVVTSEWTRQRLLDRYPLSAHGVHAAEPGVDLDEPAVASDRGDRLLCVAALTPGKGHDVLLTALAGLTDLAWSCVCVGSADRDPVHADCIQRRSRELGLADRVRFAGSLTGGELAASYATSDLLVHPSRFESYGMVVTEALARGLPVVTTSAGALPETLGLASGGRPGLLVPPDDAEALADALRRWLCDAALRERLRTVAHRRRTELPGWSRTVATVGRVLREVAA